MRKMKVQKETQKKNGSKVWKKGLMHGTAFLMATVLVSSPVASSMSNVPIVTVEAATDCVIPDGKYAILCYYDDEKCWNVLFASKDQDVARLGVDWWNGESNETFIIQNRGNKYVTIAPAHSSNLVINATLADKTPGRYLSLHEYVAGDEASLWLPIKNADGSFSFQNKATGLVIDLENGNHDIGNKLLNWTQNGYSAAQSFYLKTLSTSNSTSSQQCVLEDGNYVIWLYYSQSKCWNVLFASTEQDLARLGVDYFNSEANEVFIIKNRGNNYVTIAPQHSSNLVINATLADKTPGRYLSLHEYVEGDEASLWRPIKNADGSVSFQNKATGLMIDLENGNHDIGNKLLNWTQNGYSAAQSFYPEKLSGSNTTNTSSTTTTVSTARQNLVNYALSQVGVGDNKGDNNVVYNTWYYGHKVYGNGYAWCAAFVSYCADKQGLLYDYIPNHCNCQNGVNWFKGQEQFYASQYYGGTYIPKAGDIVYYTEDGSRANHVGIIIASPVNGYLQVVEGNVYCSDGNYKVVKFTANAKRKVDSAYVLGYGVPNY